MLFLLLGLLLFVPMGLFHVAFGGSYAFFYFKDHLR